MLPNDALQRPRQVWVRRTVRALTAAALFAVPLVALIQLGPGLVPGLAGDAAAAPAAPEATPINPLTFDAPARTVERAAVEQKDANRAAARLTAAKQEEATLLDDWHFTQSPFMQSNQFFPIFVDFADMFFSFDPANFGFSFRFITIIDLPIPGFGNILIILPSPPPRFFHRHSGGAPPIIIVINPPPVSPFH